MLARIKKIKISKVIMLLFLLPISVLWLVPLWFAIVSAFKTEAEIFRTTFTWIPVNPTLGNFEYLFSDLANVQMYRWIENSFVIATTHTILLLFISSLAAYAYARLEFRGRTFLFTTLMATMMIPGIINFIPNYVMVDRFGWLDTRYAMIFPGLSGVFGVFLLRQFFIGIPKEISESARMDGANEFTIYLRLVMPLSKPVLIALAILTFLGNWNDYFWPLIVTFRNENFTLPVGLAQLLGRYHFLRGVVLAGAVTAAVIPLAFFVIGQRFFIHGITVGAVKE